MENKRNNTKEAYLGYYFNKENKTGFNSMLQELVWKCQGQMGVQDDEQR